MTKNNLFLFPCLLIMFGSSIRMASSLSSTTKKKAGLIFLHGLGDTPAGWSSLEQALPSMQPRLKDVEYIFPPAPTIPITINGGMTMPGWFDLYDWPIGIGIQDDKDGLEKAVEQIEDCVKQLEEKGVPRNRVVVGGFSQGGAVSLLAAYNNDEKPPFAGCAALSAWLTLTEDVMTKRNANVCPLFWAHGTYDDKVLFEQQSFGVGKLKERGVSSVEVSHYPMGHESHPEELAALAKFLDKVLFGNDDNTDDSKSEL